MKCCHQQSSTLISATKTETFSKTPKAHTDFESDTDSYKNQVIFECPETDYPAHHRFADANMTPLRQTSWLINKSRQLCFSLACCHHDRCCSYFSPANTKFFWWIISQPLGDLVTDNTDLDLYSKATLSNQRADFGNARAYSIIKKVGSYVGFNF